MYALPLSSPPPLSLSLADSASSDSIASGDDMSFADARSTLQQSVSWGSLASANESGTGQLQRAQLGSPSSTASQEYLDARQSMDYRHDGDINEGNIDRGRPSRLVLPPAGKEVTTANSMLSVGPDSLARLAALLAEKVKSTGHLSPFSRFARRSVSWYEDITMSECSSEQTHPTRPYSTSYHSLASTDHSPPSSQPSSLASSPFSSRSGPHQQDANVASPTGTDPGVHDSGQKKDLVEILRRMGKLQEDFSASEIMKRDPAIIAMSPRITAARVPTTSGNVTNSSNSSNPHPEGKGNGLTEILPGTVAAFAPTKGQQQHISPHLLARRARRLHELAASRQTRSSVGSVTKHSSESLRSCLAGSCGGTDPKSKRQQQSVEEALKSRLTSTATSSSPPITESVAVAARSTFISGINRKDQPNDLLGSSVLSSNFSASTLWHGQSVVSDSQPPQLVVAAAAAAAAATTTPVACRQIPPSPTAPSAAPVLVHRPIADTL
ncbi:hypothetical protein EV182_004342 [Spiromyces aspiralis]|uniref:Uncharacterized protein n=1 Tax=Spiromyces aspiralis TaxID=68401 RepID=A0ACC1HBJ2_9FUNG|nr:hypothetical protein EV182_004342 [Spiromyces aspiralis]